MTRPNPEYVKQLLEMVSSSPYPKHMSMRLTNVDMDTAEVVLDAAACHLQPYGIVHGGVLATLIDTATFWAAFMRLAEDAGLVNVDLKLNYLKSVQTGQLKASGRTLRHGKTISYAEASVFDQAGDLAAHGTSTLMVLPGKGLSLNLPKFAEK
ncbi:MAG: PaaI family thioesterase [Thermodesulfobacteriota bacterium]